MSHSWTHSWCRSPSRDEAVRAAEDGRKGPLPTLEEAIAAVTERRPPEPRGSGNVTGLRVAYDQAVVDRLTAERDAAIRERDKLRAERITQALTADRFASAVAEADRLRARACELESAKAAAIECVEEVRAQREAAADRCAAAETALRQIVAQDYSRAAVNGASWKMHDIAEKALESTPAASGAAGTEVGRE